MANEDASWPRIYTTTLAERLNMTPKEIEELWREYRKFWRSHSSVSYLSTPEQILDREYSLDWLEDKDSLYR